MKGDLPIKEPSILKRWDHLYEKLRKTGVNKEPFTLLFGPPYANGHIHIGHALSYILKDIINKTHQMMGYEAPMIVGWDSHGLPIEWKVEEEYRKKNISKKDLKTTEQILKFRSDCREFARHWMNVQREELKRLGIIANFDHPYNTMDFESEGEVVKQISAFLLNGSLYQGLRPILWSVVEQTALADAETEYKEIVSPSIYVGFPIKNTDIQAIIWTTTPWTIPANRAISFNSKFEYRIAEFENGRKALIAKDCADAFSKTLGLSYKVLQAVSHDSLSQYIAQHPLYHFDVPFLDGDHVTLEAGTGLVHTAPGHGPDDFLICQKNGIPVPHLISDDGFYYDDVPLFAGEHIFKVAPKVIEALQNTNTLWYSTTIEHSYPHSWRSKKPLVYMVRPQWFISMEGIRSKALREIEKVEWYPKSGKNRIYSMVENRPDWCISRQRFWGTPIAIFMNKKTKEPLRDSDVQKRIIDAITNEGGDVWYTKTAQDFLGEKYSEDDYEKVMDVVDVWFDSGCVPEFVAKKRLKWPVDLVLEGSDQHRGWFQSMLLESVGVNGSAPYKKVVTHGFVLDEKGRKMSKSIGNIVSPLDITNQFGADILRLWVALSDYSEDLRIGNEILKRHQDVYRRFRNTLRYLLGALCDFNKEKERVVYDELPELEKYILHRVSQLHDMHQESVAHFKYAKFYEELHTFCSNDLSAFYFDIRKDVLYCDDPNSLKRRATRTVMYFVLKMLMRYLAPVLSFTAEEAFQLWKAQHHLPQETVQELIFLTIHDEWKNDKIFAQWENLRQLRRVVTTAIEAERAQKVIASSLEAEVTLYSNETLDVELLNEICITSKVILLPLDREEKVYCQIKKSNGQKCERCWRVSTEFHILCPRCESIVKNHATRII